MKKVLSLLLAMAMMLMVLAGCGGKNDAGNKNNSNTPKDPETNTNDQKEPEETEVKLGTEPVTITYWHSMSDDAGTLMDKYVDEFNKGIGAELKITVESVYQGKYSDASTKMKSILAAESYNELPDVMQIDATGKLAYAASEVAYTVDDAIADHPEYAAHVEKMLSGALNNWNYAGEQLGLPFSASTTITYFNKTLLDAANAAVPTSFPDVAKLAGKIPATNSAGQAVSIYAAVPNTPTLANWLGQLGSYVVNEKNGSAGTATELACIDNGALLTFLTEWKAMYDAGALKNVSGSSDEFVAGTLAIYTTSSSNISSLYEKIGDTFEMGVGKYLRVNDKAAYGATVSGGGVFMFDHQDELRKLAAWAFMEYLTSADVQADFGAGTGYIPVNTDATNVDSYKALLAEYPAYQVGIDQLSETPADMASVTVGPSTDFYYAIQDCVTAMLDDGQTPEDAVQTMGEELQTLLDEYAAANP